VFKKNEENRERESGRSPSTISEPKPTPVLRSLLLPIPTRSFQFENQIRVVQMALGRVGRIEDVDVDVEA